MFLKGLLSAAVFVSISGCGSSDGGYSDAPQPTQPPPPAAVPTWNQVAAVIQANCAKCHNGVKEPAFTSGAVFKASAAKAKLLSGAMPLPPSVISAADKATLLAYLQ